LHTYRLTLGYDGSAYAGWQRQEGFTTVQQCLEEAFARILGESIPVHGAGRTDAGVHALRQSAHVRLPVAHPCDRLLAALNGNLPRDVRVLDVAPAPAAFHARFSAIGKRYLYRYVVAPVRPPFGMAYATWVRRPLDLAAMRSAAAALVGEHDFASFASNPGYERKRGTVRTVSHLHLLRRPHGVDLVIQGNGFLYNMVRAIAGTLRQVGAGRLAPAEVGEILQARDRRRAPATAEANGLFLVRVLYRRADLMPGIRSD
jgi:tRNA pseudouridine38-40 synthase